MWNTEGANMGYTRYWYATGKQFTDEFIEKVKKIVAAAEKGTRKEASGSRGINLYFRPLSGRGKKEREN